MPAPDGQASIHDRHTVCPPGRHERPGGRTPEGLPATRDVRRDRVALSVGALLKRAVGRDPRRSGAIGTGCAADAVRLALATAPMRWHTGAMLTTVVLRVAAEQDGASLTPLLKLAGIVGGLALLVVALRVILGKKV